MEHAEELASLFGPDLTSFIGQDDKAHVPTGITAVNKQAPIANECQIQSTTSRPRFRYRN